MSRTELTFAVAATLIGAVLLGWLLAWITSRLNDRKPGDLAQASDLAERLHAAEGREADLGARLDEAEAELAAALDRLAQERAHTEEIRAAYREAMQRRGA